MSRTALHRSRAARGRERTEDVGEIEALRKALARAERRLQEQSGNNDRERDRERDHRQHKNSAQKQKSRRKKSSVGGSESASRTASTGSSRSASRRNSGRERSRATREQLRASNEATLAIAPTGQSIDLSALALDRRFEHAVTQIVHSNAHDEGHSLVYICRDAERGNALCVKKVAFADQARSALCRETAVHRCLERIVGSERHIVTLIAAWHAQKSHAALVMPLVKLGPLGDALTERSIAIDAARVQEWLESSTAALDWLHRCALHVHCNTTLQYWLLVEPNRLVLSDFGRCWARREFVDARNFDTFRRYDAVVFLDELQSAMRIEHERDAVLESEDEHRTVNWHACNRAVAEHSRSKLFYCYAMERTALRAQVTGSDEECAEMAKFDAFDVGSDSSGSGVGVRDTSTRRALRQQLVRNFDTLHLRMNGDAHWTLEY